MNNKYIPHLLFLGFFLLTAWFYNYHNLVSARPQSLHAWRQADGASLALNYSRNGMKFFQPETHNLTSDKGNSGKVAPSETPILYYYIALQYKVFGYHEFIFRLWNTVFFFLGLLALFGIINRLSGDSFWSVSIPLFLFSSPVLAYYANNYISNTTAFSFVLMGWYFFFKYYDHQKLKKLILPFVFFTIAAALKITALFSVLALGLLIIADSFRLLPSPGKKQHFRNHVQLIMVGILIILPSVLWIFYARDYNLQHDTTYFSTTIFPVWELSSESISDILSSIRQNLLADYFHPSALIFLGLLFFLTFFLADKGRFFRFMPLILLPGMLLYICLQFWTFRDHDYYTVNMYILPVFILINAVSVLKKSDLQPGKELVIKIAFALFLVFNLVHATNRLHFRYHDRNHHFREYRDFYSLTQELRKAGIFNSDRCISFSDFGHTSLYLMDQPGWTRYADMRYNRGNPVLYNRDREGIQKSIDNGASWLILNGFEDLFRNSFLEEFCQHLALSYRNILVFDLNTEKSNFSLNNREAKVIYHCSAEITDKEQKVFIDSLSGFVFKTHDTQSEEKSLHGKYSVGLNADKAFGMTCTLDSLNHGESIRVSVWKKGNSDPYGIVARANVYEDFNKTRSVKTGREKNGWEEIALDFFIPYEIAGQDISIYLYHPGEDIVFFDDLQIVRYHSIIKKENDMKHP